MNFAKTLATMPEKTYVGIVKAALWLVPTAGICGLRFFVDAKEDRTKMLLRDLSTFTSGIAFSLFGSELLEKQLTKFKTFENFRVRNFTALMTGLGAYVLYSGIGAPKLSQFFANRKRKGAASLNADNIVPMDLAGKLDVTSGVKSATTISFAKQPTRLRTAEPQPSFFNASPFAHQTNYNALQLANNSALANTYSMPRTLSL